MKIVSTTALPHEGFDKLLKQYPIVFPTATYFSAEEVTNLLANTDILITTFDYPITAKMLQNAPQLRLVANLGAGYNNIDIAMCKAQNIVVSNTPEPVIEPTAELAFALMHAVARQTVYFDKITRQDKVQFGVMENLSHSLCYKKLGIIGMGRIGQALARRALAAKMEIIYHNRHQLPAEIEQTYQAKYVSLDELLQTADFVSLNLPYFAENHHIISAEQLQKMKPTAYLINTARGKHVDEKALVQALKSKEIAGAALDVFEDEPHINDALKQMDNVVLSPHTGTGTYEGRVKMCQNVQENILYFLNNELEKMNLVK